MATLRFTFSVANYAVTNTTTGANAVRVYSERMPSFDTLLHSLRFYNRIDGKTDWVEFSTYYSYFTGTTSVSVANMNNGVMTSYSSVPLTNTKNSDGTYTTEFVIPDEVAAAIRNCVYAGYSFYPATTVMGRDVTFLGTSFDGGSIVYNHTIADVTYKSPTFFGELSGATGPIMSFDNLVPNPYPDVYYYFNSTSPLVFATVPDIFWTNKVLSVED